MFTILKFQWCFLVLYFYFQKPTESEYLAQQQLKSDGGIDSIKNQLLQLNTAKKHVQWGQSFGVFIKDTMPKVWIDLLV